MPRTEVSRRMGGGAVPPLLERRRELKVLQQATDRVAEGAGSLLLVEGAAGIGKTRLLAEAAELGRRRNLLVRLASGGELERNMPFGVARQLLEPVIERASEEERSLFLAGSARLALIAFGRDHRDPSRAAVDPFAPIHGLYWLLANISDARPVLLAIDDAHWADTETVRFLNYLARRLADLPVLIVVTSRPGEPDRPPELEPLRLEAEVLHPSSLTPSAVRDLIAAELGLEPSTEFVDACASATAGNPFLVTEVLRALRADALEPGRQAADVIATLGPESVASYALLRLGRFGNDSIALARAIAVLGGSPQLRHVAKLAGLDEDRARALCDSLHKAEILAPGLPIDFVHALVRQAIYRDLPEGERSHLHRQAAEVLSSTGVGSREIAPHLLACAPNGDQWVVARLREAAREATAEGALDSAKLYLERALKEPPDEELHDLYWLGRALLDTEPARAPEVLTVVAERASDPGLRLDALRFAALAHLAIGNVGECVRFSLEALDAVPKSDREQALVLESQIYCFGVASRGRDSARSERIKAAAIDLEGKTPGECLVRQSVALDRFLDCDPVEEVVELAARFPPAEIGGIRVPMPLITGKVLAYCGRYDQAHEAMTLFTEARHESGQLNGASHSHGVLAEIDRLGGRLADAEAEARTASEIASALGNPLAGWQANMNLLLILITKGDLEGAASFAEALPLSLGPREVPMNPWPIEARAYLRLAQGDLAGAVEDLLALGDAAESFGYRNPALPPWRQEVVPALVALGRTAEAEGLIAEAEQRARHFGAPHLVGTVLRARAFAESRKDQIETLRESVAALEVYGPPHELARSLVELGAALRRDGRRAEAREPLNRALELAHRCGAGGLEERAGEELVAAGSRPRRPFHAGAASLSASELRTAKLALQGLNNREIAERLFVTRRTVETHLTHVYQKLQIGGRGDLKAALADQEGLSP